MPASRWAWRQLAGCASAPSVEPLDLLAIATRQIVIDPAGSTAFTWMLSLAHPSQRLGELAHRLWRRRCRSKPLPKIDLEPMFMTAAPWPHEG